MADTSPSESTAFDQARNALLTAIAAERAIGGPIPTDEQVDAAVGATDAAVQSLLDVPSSTPADVAEKLRLCLEASAAEEDERFIAGEHASAIIADLHKLMQ